MNRFTPLVVALLSLSGALRAQTWVKDATLDPDLRNEVPVVVDATYVPKPDGGFLVVGDFTHALNRGLRSDGLLKVDRTGLVDRVFQTAPQTGVLNGKSYPLPDGRVLRSRYANGRWELIRLKADGTPDESYTALPTFTAVRFFPLKDGRLAIAPGVMQSEMSTSLSGLSADGTPDATFVPPRLAGYVRDAAPLPDGGILVVAGRELIRIGADGSVPSPLLSRFPLLLQNEGGKVATLPDGRFLLSDGPTLHRFSSAGDLDPTFSFEFPNLRWVHDVEVREDGTAVVEVSAGTGLAASPHTVLILNARGLVAYSVRDLVGHDQTVHLHALLSDGSLLISHGRPVILNEPMDGIITTATPAVTTEPTTFVPLPGSIVVPDRPVLRRVDATLNGSEVLNLGLSRREPGMVYPTGTAIDGGGRLVLAGRFTAAQDQASFGIARFRKTGVEAGFAPKLPGTPLGIAYQTEEGDLLVQHDALLATGVDGVSRRSVGHSWVSSMGEVLPVDKLSGLQPGWLLRDKRGRFLIGTMPGGTSAPQIARLGWYDKSGNLLELLPVVLESGYRSFLRSNEYDNPFHSAAILPTGMLLVAGSYSAVDGGPRRAIVRLRADGTLDPTYAPLPDETLSTFMVDTDGAVTASRQVWRHGRPETSTYNIDGDGKLGTARINPAPYESPRWKNGDELRSYDPFLPRVDEAWGVQRGDAQQHTLLDHFIATDQITLTVRPAATRLVTGQDHRLYATLGTRTSQTLQWHHNGTPLPGATSPVLVLPEVTESQAGVYELRASLPGDVQIAASATVGVERSTTHLVNGSALVRVDGGPAPVLGFAIHATEARPWLIRGIGPTLTRFRVDSPLLDPRVALFRGTSLVAERAGRRDEAEALALAHSLGAFPHDEPSPALHDLRWRDTALVSELGQGTYSLHATSLTGRTGQTLLEIYDSAPGNAARSVRNLSLRAQLTPETRLVTLGFVLSGNGPAKLLFRAVGPTLRNHGVVSPLADPRLSIFYRRFGPVSTGRVEDDHARTAAAQIGTFPLNPTSADLAWVEYLEPGAYTAQLTSASSGDGDALIEVYLLD